MTKNELALTTLQLAWHLPPRLAAPAPLAAVAVAHSLAASPRVARWCAAARALGDAADEDVTVECDPDAVAAQPQPQMLLSPPPRGLMRW